jgi:hypothetical protein
VAARVCELPLAAIKLGEYGLERALVASTRSVYRLLYGM